MASPKQYACTAWYMEYRDGSSDKFYQVIISESGICTLRWGRRGAAGQSSTHRYPSFDEARDVGLRQVYAKKSKGYEQQYEDMKFMGSEAALAAALNGRPEALVNELNEARANGQFEGAKQAVLAHYADFAEQVQNLLHRAATGDTNQTMNEYEQLETVWAELDDKHAEVNAAMSIAKATLMQKLMSGAL